MMRKQWKVVMSDQEVFRGTRTEAEAFARQCRRGLRQKGHKVVGVVQVVAC